MPTINSDLIFCSGRASFKIGKGLIEACVLALQDTDPIKADLVALASAPGTYPKEKLERLVTYLAEAAHLGEDETGLSEGIRDPSGGIMAELNSLPTPLHPWELLANALRLMTFLSIDDIQVVPGG